MICWGLFVVCFFFFFVFNIKKFCFLFFFLVLINFDFFFLFFFVCVGGGGGGGGACPQTPLEDGALRPLNCNSCLLLFYHPPTSNFIENPASLETVPSQPVVLMLLFLF